MADENIVAPVTASEVTPEVVPSSGAPEVDSSSDAEQVENTAVESTTTDPAETASEPPAKGGRAEERIHDLVAERNAAKEYAEYWREKALEVVRANSAPQQPQAPAQEPPAPVVRELPPTLEECGYDQSRWAQETAKWTAAYADVRVNQALRQQASARVQNDLVANFEQKVEEFRKDHPDFDIVVSNPKLPQLDRVAAAMVVSSEHSAALTYALAKNPEQAVRISRMSPPQQALAIGRLENEVRTPTKTPEPPKQAARPVTQTTKAPPPPAPVPSGGVADVDPSTTSVDDWMKMRLGETRARRRGGRLA